MNTRLLLDERPEFSGLLPGIRPSTLAKIDKREDSVEQAKPFPVISTRGIIRKLRGTREWKCASAFETVIEGMRCQ